MAGIVCAVRGGPASQPTIARAIELAVETGRDLYFLYVVNLDFMAHTSTSRVHTISQEMHEMGEFILLSAQSQAEAQGVQARGFVRHGNVWDEIICLGQEKNADFILLGKPKDQEGALATHELLEAFSQRVEDETGASIVLADAEV